MAPRSVVLAAPLVLVLGLGLSSAAVASQPTPQTEPTSAAREFVPETADDLPAGSVIANEAIYQIARDGDRVYAYGNFDSVGRYAGPGAVLNATTGAPVDSPVIADGQVSVSVADGTGGWYLGGDFTRIDGHAAGGLAHVLADGTLDTGFLPVADKLVSAMALDGDTLYVGGAFNTVDGIARDRLAALSTDDGSLLPFDAPQPMRVTELVAAAPEGLPERLYVASNGLHALDPVTGALIPGFSAPGFTGSGGLQVHALELGGTRLYVGTGTVTALDPGTGAVDTGFDTGKPLSVETMEEVDTLLYTADRLYIGGDRSLIQGRPGRLAAVDPDTGAIDLAFKPIITDQTTTPYQSSGVYDLALNGDQLWAGGSFAGGLTIVDPVTGAADDTALPSYNLQVNAVELSDGQAYVGGHFYMTGAVSTRGLAAFDADTLDPIPGFHARTREYGDLFTGAGAVWVASTNFMGYDPSANAAESSQFFYPWTQTVTAFNPDTGAKIEKRSLKVKNLTGITTVGNRVYIARRLENDQRYPRNRIDVYAPSGKRVDTFLVPVAGYITELSSLGGDLIVAGSFVPAQGDPTALLKLDPATGHRIRFTPRIEGPVYDVFESGKGLIAAGLFERVWDSYGTSAHRPGLTRMKANGQRDNTFAPPSFDGNRVLVHIAPLGNLLWVQGASHEYVNIANGAVVPDPIDDEFPMWVTGTDGDLAYTSFIMPNLGGRTGYKIGYVAAAH